MINKSGIYQILNTVNGKRYIGSAVNLKNRRESHFQSLRRGDHQVYLQNSWNKHGENKFRFEILIICSKELLLFYEQRFLDALWHTKPGLYNICPTAGNTLGMKHRAESILKLKGRKFHVEHREKISKSRIRLFAGPEGDIHRKNISDRQSRLFNGPKGDEYRARISRANKGRPGWNKGIPLPPAQRKHLSEINKGTKYRAGTITSPTAKENIARANRSRCAGKPSWNKGIPMSQEAREKLSKSTKGKKTFSEEARRNMSKGQTGRKLSEETKLKISIKAKERYAVKRGGVNA